MRALDRPARLHDAHVVHVLLEEAHLADPRGVHEAVAPAPALEHLVHGVARRPRDGRDDGALAPEQAVEDRRLPDVGPPDEREGEGRRLVLVGRHAGQPREGGVEQVADALPVLRGDEVGPVEAEPRELGEVLLAALGLVHHDEDALARAPQPAGDRLVVRQQARAAVHQEEHHVRLLDRPLGLQRGGPEERVVRAEEQPARVDELEGVALPAHLGVVAVAGRARAAVGDGLAAAADPVEERGLADVGAADEGDSREGDHGFWGPPAVDTGNEQSLY